MSSEIEFFDDIFENFVDLEETFDDHDLWKSNSILKLMKVSDTIKNEHFIADGLKIILNLYKFKECGSLNDSYESESYPIDDLVEPDKELLVSILKAETI